jgi:hypothetical protein
MQTVSNTLWSGTLLVRGVEFSAQCAFDFTFTTWKEAHGERMGEISDIEPSEIVPTESLTIAARETLIQWGFPNNAKTRKRARFMGRKIARDLETLPPGRFISEDDFTDEAARS